MLGLKMLGAGALVALLLGIRVVVDRHWQRRCRPGAEPGSSGCHDCQQHDCPSRRS